MATATTPLSPTQPPGLTYSAHYQHSASPNLDPTPHSSMLATQFPTTPNPLSAHAQSSTVPSFTPLNSQHGALSPSDHIPIDSAGLPPSISRAPTASMSSSATSTYQTTPASSATPTPDPARPSLESIRTHISEQFDLEILLKHREMRLIEQEIAKTQISLEQLRRCTLLPYAKSAEAQLDEQGMGMIPPVPGVVDGPYTRHYRQWLIPHPTLDGNSVEPFVPPPPQWGAGLGGGGMGLGMGMAGRPQRQSAIKAQTKTGEQVCLYRKRDGTLVRLECQTCHRSNFSSAQGFINHCRIAHQTEYSSHDAAADACGQPVDETEEALMTPLNARGPIDGPARHTRQQLSPSFLTPLPPRRATKTTSNTASGSHHPETPYVNPYILSNTPTPSNLFASTSGNAAPPPFKFSSSSNTGTSTSHNTHRRTQSHSAASSRRVPGSTISNSSTTKSPSHRPPTPPLDLLATPHLQNLLKRKKIALDVGALAQDVTRRRQEHEDGGDQSPGIDGGLLSPPMAPPPGVGVFGANGSQGGKTLGGFGNQVRENVGLIVDGFGGRVGGTTPIGKSSDVVDGLGGLGVGPEGIAGNASLDVEMADCDGDFNMADFVEDDEESEDGQIQGSKQVRFGLPSG